MNVLSLNLWCGNVYDALMPFLEMQKDTIDVFCFQEVHDTTDPDVPKRMGSTVTDVHDLFAQLKALLSDHTGLYAPRFGSFGQAIFIRKGILIDAYTVRTMKDGFGRILSEGNQPSIAQCIDIVCDGTNYRMINVHGLWIPGKGKGDSPERIEQSEAILQLVSESDRSVILCGDLNLDLDTESIHMLERAGLRNWVRNNGITSTRSELYTKVIRFADYIFTSRDIPVTSFEVLPDTVSDHLPLRLALS